MTKKQFIKRVEKITGYQYNGRDINDNYIFKPTTSQPFPNNFIISNSHKGIGMEKIDNIFVFIPDQWLIPLGKALKEYYETN